MPCWPTRRLCSASSLESTVPLTEGAFDFFKFNPLTSLIHTSVWLLFFFLRRNPLGCAVAIASLDVLIDEKLAERAERLGQIFRSEISALNHPLVRQVRGRGLLNAVVFEEGKSVKGRSAWQFCLLLKSKGLLAKPTHVRFLFLACFFVSYS